MTEWKGEDKGVMTNWKVDDKGIMTEWKGDDKGIMTEWKGDDKGIMTEWKGEEKGIMTEWKGEEKGIMTEWKGEDKGTCTVCMGEDKCIMTEQKEYGFFKTYMRDLFQPGQPSSHDLTQNKVVLKWEKPNIGDDLVHKYAVIRKDINTSHTETYFTMGNTCKLTIGSLQPATKYEFIVQPIRFNGVEGIRSESCIVETLSLPAFMYSKSVSCSGR